MSLNKSLRIGTAVVAVAMAATACGGSSSKTGTGSGTTSTTRRAAPADDPHTSAGTRRGTTC